MYAFLRYHNRQKYVYWAFLYTINNDPTCQYKTGLRILVTLYGSIILGRCGGSFGSAPDFWRRGPGFESGISHNDPGALQDHCVIL